MEIHIFTLFPESCEGPLQASILKRAQERGLLTVRLHDVREYAEDRHRVCDDYPYGGGAGMVLKPEPVFAAVEAVLGPVESRSGVPVILMTPQGRVFHDRMAREFSGYERLALICGRYEGVDERIREHLATQEVSIGDYVLSGGELPALVLVDAVARFLPGALGDETSAQTESYAEGLLEHPHYTRPAEFRGWRVPEVLLSGHHAEIARWRRQQALLRTRDRRPDLLERAPLTETDRSFLLSLTKDDHEAT